MKNRRLLSGFGTSLLGMTLLLLSGCAAYDKMAEGTNGKLADWYTSMRDGDKKIVIEDTPNAKKLKLNLKYRLATGSYMAHEPPRLTGDFVYENSCPKYFTFDAVLKNADDVEITSKKIGVGKYEGGSKRMFDVDVYRQEHRGDSDKVKTILVQHITCA